LSLVVEIRWRLFAPTGFKRIPVRAGKRTGFHQIVGKSKNLGLLLKTSTGISEESVPLKI
jgi:hypothetical protein